MAAMPYLFRSAVLIARKQPYLDWANSLADPGATLTMELAQQRDVYLGSHTDELPTLDALLDDIWDEIFEEELFAWSTDEQQWPGNRTRQMFDEWFTAELCDSVIDLVPDEPLTEDDIDLQDLQIALSTCSVCRKELATQDSRLVPRARRELDGDERS